MFGSLYCTKEIDPYSASLTQVADFSSDSITDGLQYRTIAGYTFLQVVYGSDLI